MDLEELQTKHRKEIRDLQSRVTQKKKAATKKNRRAVNSECEDLERQLKERHEREIAELHGEPLPDQDEHILVEASEDQPDDRALQSAEPPTDELTSSLHNATLSEAPKPNENQPKKRNRQKDRLARRAAEREAAADEAEKEAALLPNWKRMERSAMVKAFKENGLEEKEIQPDGHCLFSSVADQLVQANIPLAAGSENVSASQTYKIVRRAAAEYIKDHPDDFSGFMDEPLDQYVTKIRDTAEWGGQLELIALARTYNVEIRVLQEGRLERIKPTEEEDEKRQKLWLAYYRHGYGLGEHYNSLRTAS